MNSKNSGDGRGPWDQLAQPLTLQRLRAIQQLVQGHRTSEWKIKGQNPSLFVLKDEDTNVITS